MGILVALFVAWYAAVTSESLRVFLLIFSPNGECLYHESSFFLQ